MQVPHILFLPALATLASGCGAFDTLDECEDNLAVAGALSVDGANVDFDNAELFLNFSTAAGDDACIYETSGFLAKGGEITGCTFHLSTTPLLDGSGRLQLDEVSLLVDPSQCPTWSVPEGSYFAERADGPIGTVSFDSEVDVGDVGGCYEGTVTIDLVAFTAGSQGGSVDVAASTITVSGTKLATGQMASCATPG